MTTTITTTKSTALQFARVPVISDEKCKQYYICKKTSLETENRSFQKTFQNAANPLLKAGYLKRSQK